MSSKCFFVTAFLLVFIYSDYGIHGAEYGLCSEINLTMKAYTIPEHDLVYMYTADISLSPGEDEFHTNLSITRQFGLSLNSSLYYQNISSYPGCSTINGDCSIFVEDGVIWQSYNLIMAGEEVMFNIFDGLMIDQGTFFVTADSFDPSGPPCRSTGESGSYTGDYTYCCTKYKYFTIPDEPNPCLDLKETTKLFDINNHTVTVVETDYLTTSDGIFFNLTGILLSENGSFLIWPNYFDGCDSSDGNPCSFLYAIGETDFQVDNYFGVSFYGSEYSIGIFTMNKLIRRSGIFMKNQTHAFTTENSCMLSFPETTYAGTHATVKTCCSRFKQTHDSHSVFGLKQKYFQFHDNTRKKSNLHNAFTELLSGEKIIAQPRTSKMFNVPFAL